MRKVEKKDLLTINDWMGRRNLPAIPADLLPEVGLIEDATACGFLVKTDTPIAILEYFVTNPLADKKERDESLSKIASALTLTAKGLGFKKIICNTKFKNIYDVAVKQAFIYTGDYSTFYKEI